MIGKIALVINWLPRVIAVTMLVEELLRAGTPGSVKKEKALEFLKRQGLAPKYVDVIGSLVDLVVDVLHATGMFKRVKNVDDAVIVADEDLNPAVRETVQRQFDDVYRSLLDDGK